MTAVPRYPTPPAPEPTPSEALVRHAAALQGAGRSAEAVAALRDAITIDPDCLAAHRALALHLANSGRDLEAFAACAQLLAGAGRQDAESLRLAAELLLFLHIRHATLLTRQAEPVRLDFRAIGVPDVAPMVLAPEFLRRARALARAAVSLAPRDVIAHATLAECDLRAGYASAARKAAERAVEAEASVSSLVARALATFADHREVAAVELLRQPQLTELIPSLGTGQQSSLRVEGAFSPATVAHDRERMPWTIPYVVQHGGTSHARQVTVRTGAPEARTIRNGRVVGGLAFPLDRSDRGYIHGIVDEPDVQFGVPRFHDIPTALSQSRNTVLWHDDRRALLHSPQGERVRGGRVVLLASNFSANYYHWIADALGRLAAVPGALTDPDLRFVVPAPLHPFQVETLAWLGISLERMVQVADDEIAEFDEVIAVHHRKEGGCTDRGVWQWLRDRLTIPSLHQSPTPVRRLFLRRGAGAAMRRVLNEAALESICRDLGFEAVETSRLTVAEQRDLFAEAAVVVSPVGASLTNLLFAPAGTRTILFGQRGYIVPCYNALADAMGHSVRYLLGHEEQSAFVYPHWDYRIDEDELRQALRAELG